MNLKARPSDPLDPHLLAPFLRHADVQEIKACSGHTPLEALLTGLTNSKPCYSVVKPNDHPIAMFGVVPTGDDRFGSVWMLGSNEIITHHYQFVRETSKWIDKLHEHFPVLWNFVDKRNVIHIAWLKRVVGVQFLREVSYGVEERPFLEFIHV